MQILDFDVLAEALPRRTKVAISQAITRKGISTKNNWSYEEEKILKQTFKEGYSICQQMELLPGRTYGAIRCKRKHLGLMTYDRWSKHDIETIKQISKWHSVKELAEIFGRSYLGTYQILRRYNLPVGRDRQNRDKRKLTDFQAKEIKVKYKTGKHSFSSLAREYGVTRSTIGRITNGEGYRDVK